MANFSKSFNFRNGVQVDDDKFIVKPTTGLVGIGSTAPTQVLDVAGNIKADGVVNSANVEVGTGITVGINSSISIDGVTGLITAVSYFGDGSTLTNVVAIATAGFKELSGTLSTTSSVGIGSESAGFPDFTLDVNGDVRVTGPSTFIGVTTTSDLFANTLSVSNSSSFDDVLVSGVSTFSALTDVNNRLDVVGGANIDQTNVSGVSTFGGAIDANAGADISGGETVLSSATVSDLTDNRIVIAGTSGALEDSGNLTFTGTQFTVTGNAAINGDLQVASGTLEVDGVAGVGSLAVAGVSTFSALLDVNNRLDVVGGANIDQLNVTGVSTLTGRLTATEINSASSNVVRLLQSGTQVLNTIGAGVSVSNTLKIGSLNGGASGLSTHDATLIYGDESGVNAFMTRRSLNILNNDTGNFNYFLNINNLKDSESTDRTGDFVWHKASNALMTLTGIGGSLGIGVTTPSAALEVVGGATLGGAVIIAGNATVGGSMNVNGGNVTVNSGSFIGDVVGNVAGNLTGNVDANSIGVSTLHDLIVQNVIGIGSTGNAGEVLFVNPSGISTGGDDTDHNKFFINDEGRVGVGTTALTGQESNRVTIHGDIRIHAGSVLVGNSVVPKSAVDFSDVVNVPDQGGGYSWPVDRSRIAYMIPPKVTTAQRNSMYDGSGNGGLGGGTVVTGALLFNTTLNRLELYDGNGWVGLATVA